MCELTIYTDNVLSTLCLVNYLTIYGSLWQLADVRRVKENARQHIFAMNLKNDNLTPT